MPACIYFVTDLGYYKTLLPQYEGDSMGEMILRYFIGHLHA